jgi:hypothetical protein
MLPVEAVFTMNFLKLGVNYMKAGNGSPDSKVEE